MRRISIICVAAFSVGAVVFVLTFPVLGWASESGDPSEIDDVYENKLRVIPPPGFVADRDLSLSRGAPVKISQPMAPGGDVFNYLVSPDFSTIVYRADQETDEVFELYSVPISGGASVKLNAAVVSPGVHSSFAIDPQSTVVVYSYGGDLHSVPITGGTPTLISDPVNYAGNFRISQDGATVVYRAFTAAGMEIYSVPISGGTSIRLNQDLPATHTAGVYGAFDISDDGSLVLYRIDLTADDAFDLYSVPIAGGTRVHLNGTLAPLGSVVDHDSVLGRTHYRADQGTDEVYELYSVPDVGGTAVKLNGPLTIDGDVEHSRVGVTQSYYLADQDTDEIVELYAVPVEGGTAVKLNPLLVTGGDVLAHVPTHGEDNVLYLADQDTDDVVELYRVPATGGTASRISGTLTAGGDVLGYGTVGITDMVAYLADQETDEAVEVYSVPLAGGTPAKCSGALVTDGDVVAGSISWAGLLWYLADQETDEVFEMYQGPLDGSVPATKLNGTLVAGGDVADYGFGWPWVVYRADQETDDVFELYSVLMDGDIDADGTIDGRDCIVYDDSVWDLPGETNGTVMVGKAATTISWNAPPDLGGNAVVYDTIRSNRADDFVSAAVCVETNDGIDTMAMENATPSPGEVYFYVVRAENTCGQGSSGTDSSGNSREARACD